jgi:NAD(P)-dependent dehydrogenase (short-subunit alcohol dehydrogenase family)
MNSNNASHNTSTPTSADVVVITGGSRGIGASTAMAAARRGLGVILTYNASPDAAHAVVRDIESLGGKAAALRLDVAAVDTFAAFRAEVERALADVWRTTRLAGLVNNAGYGLFQPIADVTEAQFDGLFNVHLKGPFFLTQALLPLLRQGAGIVNLTSVRGAALVPDGAGPGGGTGRGRARDRLVAARRGCLDQRAGHRGVRRLRRLRPQTSSSPSTCSST